MIIVLKLDNLLTKDKFYLINEIFEKKKKQQIVTISY